MSKIFESPDGGKTVYERESGAPANERRLVNSEQEFETCVVCGKQTNVPVKQHVDFRDFYVEGAGQLCKSCYLGEDRKLFAIPERFIRDYPNDLELGAAVKRAYWELKKK